MSAITSSISSTRMRWSENGLRSSHIDRHRDCTMRLPQGAPIMRIRRNVLALAITSCTLFSAAQASAQSVKDPAKWAIDFGAGLSPSINGNVNSGAIGVYQGQTTAILPNSYGDVYGTGIELRFGGGYALNNNTEVRG